MDEHQRVALQILPGSRRTKIGESIDMKRSSILAMVFLATTLMVAPAPARLRPLADLEMAGIKGQGHLAILANDPISLNLSLERLSYYDADGVGPGSQGAYLSLNGVNMQGSMSWITPVGIVFGPFSSMLEPTQVNGMDISIDDMAIRIDHLAIDAIRVGAQPGSGFSFGSLEIKNFLLQVSGHIQIYAH
jgi:hypothetical protein